MSRSPSIVQTFFQQYVKDASLAISCKSGQRSAAVAQELVQAGMFNARNRKTVYLPWCGRFDPSLPHYGASGDRKMALYIKSRVLEKSRTKARLDHPVGTCGMVTSAADNVIATRAVPMQNQATSTTFFSSIHTKSSGCSGN